jgi:hypothetical protein
MNYLTRYELHESSSWIEDEIKKYDIDIKFIKDICQDLIDDEFSIIIRTYFMDKNFTMLSKKIDALKSDNYLCYSVYISNIKNHSDVDGFIGVYNMIFEVLKRLDSIFNCKVMSYNNGSIHIYCLDLSSPLDVKNIDYKGKKAQKLKSIGLTMIDNIFNILQTNHNKILDVKIISSDTIEVSPKDNIDRVSEILHRIFYKVNDRIVIFQKDDKIFLKIR